jgi:hypothetical protein
MNCSPDPFVAEINCDQKNITSRTTVAGLTGASIALPTEDGRELDRRFEILDAELAPRSELARQLVIRVALLTVRLDRSAEQEAKAIAHRMRRARDEFDDARLAEAEHLIGWIANEPATNARRLRRSLEGLDLLIGKMEALRTSLVRPQGCRWDLAYCDQLLNLMGMRISDSPMPRARVLSEAMEGRFQHLDEADGAGLDIQRRKEWALCELVDLIGAEIARLKDLLGKFDREAIELDREAAVARALFDHSKEAILARKYEASTERGLYRALREFNELQAKTPAKKEVAADPAEKLGSSFPDESAGINKSTNVDATRTETAGGLEKAPKSDPEVTPNRRNRRGSGRSGGR